MKDQEADEEAELLRAAVGRFVRRGRAHDTMPPGQAAVLGHLVREGAFSIAALARLEGVKHQSMTRTVGLLAEQRLIELHADPDDGRRVVVRATRAGAAALRRERERRAGWIAAALRTLPAEDRAAAAAIPRLLDTLSRHE